MTQLEHSFVGMLLGSYYNHFGQAVVEPVTDAMMDMMQVALMFVPCCEQLPYREVVALHSLADHLSAVGNPHRTVPAEDVAAAYFGAVVAYMVAAVASHTACIAGLGNLVE